MFASRLNAKIKKYVSFHPDHEAHAIDAFTLDWSQELLYMFPPFSLIPRNLQKVQPDKAEAVLIAPVWKTQTWRPHLLKLLCHSWHQLPPAQEILFLHHKPGVKHPLKHLKLGVFRISGMHYDSKTYSMTHVTL